MATWAEVSSELVPIRAVAKTLGTSARRLIKLSLEGKFPPLFHPAPGIACILRKDLDELLKLEWTDKQSVQHKFNRERVASRATRDVIALLPRAARER